LVALLLPATALCVGYLLQDWTTNPEHISNLLSRLWASISTRRLGGDLGVQVAEALAAAGTLASALLTWWKGLKVFGTTPASLMASMRGATRLRDLKAQAGFRHEFQLEFREVAEALKPRHMVIIIDDLDRCRPDNVVDVLESINFLTSAGDCFVILGMDPDFVEGCVGLRFKEVAEELAEEPLPGARGATRRREEGGRAVRRAFARQYLEKLVTLELVLPRATEEQLEDLVAPGAASPGEANAAERDRRARDARAQATRAQWGGRVAVAAVVAVVVTVLGFLVGRRLGSGGEGAALPSGVEFRRAAGTAGGAGADALAAQAPRSGRPGTLVLPERPPALAPLEVGGAVVALLLLVGVPLLLLRPDVVVRDSAAFGAALRAWSKPMYQRQVTPRGAKKYVNRVRYLAMHQRGVGARRALSQRFAARLHRGAFSSGFFGRLGVEPVATAEPAGRGDRPTFSEHVLVSLTSVQEQHPEWLDDQALWTDLPAFLERHANGESAVPAEVVRLLREVKEGWQLGPNARGEFEALTATVRRHAPESPDPPLTARRTSLGRRPAPRPGSP
jgi:hypothetical protein